MNARVPRLDPAAFRQLTTPRMALLTPGHLHPATTANTPGLQPGRLALGSRRTTCPARSSQPAHYAGSALQTGSFSTCTSARITFSETTALNRTMTIPVTRATGLAKTEALRGRWPMSLSRGAGLTGCRPGGGGSLSSTDLRCLRRGVLMAVKNAIASGDLAGELTCLTRTLKAPRCAMGCRGLAERAGAESWTHDEFFTAGTRSRPESDTSRGSCRHATGSPIRRPGVAAHSPGRCSRRPVPLSHPSRGDDLRCLTRTRHWARGS